MKLWSNSILLSGHVYVHQATYIDVITKQNFDFAISSLCANNQQNVNELDSKCDEQLILIQKRYNMRFTIQMLI